MEVKVVREGFGDKSTEGKLYINGEFQCFTLEDVDRKLETGGKKVQNFTCIPRGKYKVVWNHSARFGKDMPQILDVPQFEGVRIHGGNSDKDTEGCILVGSVNNNNLDDWISKSQDAVGKLYNKIKTAYLNGEKITIEVV